MRDDKALALFSKILEKTRQGEMSWKATAEEGQYMLALPNNRYLKIYPFTIMDDFQGPKGPASVTLYSEKNQIIVDITYEIDGITKDELKELETLARRKALNIDEQVEQVLKELDEKPF